jgi:hypothetical protein
VFRRTSKVEAHPTDLEPKGPGAKGRPTPTRKEAEAARKERARGVTDKKTAARLQRESRGQSSSQVRQGMRSGDERYLPKRDQGPDKRFIRNFVDARVSIAEFLLPLLIVILVFQWSGGQLRAFSNALWTTTLLVVALDTVWLLFRLRRAMRAAFPDETFKGTIIYTLMRVMQVRFLRMPKPQVKIGGAPR